MLLSNITLYTRKIEMEIEMDRANVGVERERERERERDPIYFVSGSFLQEREREEERAISPQETRHSKGKITSSVTEEE